MPSESSSVQALAMRCNGCDEPLPLRAANQHEQALLWHCSRCSTEIPGVLIHNYTLDALGSLQPQAIAFDRHALAQPSGELVELARRLEASHAKGIEKRTTQRHPVLAIVPAWELDRNLQTVGVPFATICRNLSRGGVRLFNERLVRAEFLALELTRPHNVPLQTVIHILRRRPLGPFHDVGARFVTKYAPAR